MDPKVTALIFLTGLLIAAVTFATFILGDNAAPLPENRVERRHANFEQCRKLIRGYAVRYGSPAAEMETQESRMARFCTDTGTMMVTCSRGSEMMVQTYTDKPCR